MWLDLLLLNLAQSYKIEVIQLNMFFKFFNWI